MLFERTFQLTYRLARDRGRLGRDSLGALRKLVLEENHHSRAYVAFLRGARGRDWKQKGVLLGHRSIPRAVIFRLIRVWPAAYWMLAARLEVHSVIYGREALKAKDGAEDAWIRLQRMHLADEVHHVGFVLDLIERELEGRRGVARLSFVWVTRTVAALMQWEYVPAFWRLAGLVSEGTARVRVFFALMAWGNTRFEPVVQTCAEFREMLRARPRLRSLL